MDGSVQHLTFFGAEPDFQGGMGRNTLNPINPKYRHFDDGGGTQPHLQEFRKNQSS
ncbi:MAG: hypothetical protein Q9P90_14630 [candidate division KSB1 bacterium]|nr:hypothetical protein [candidate division KSB1 bacterium]